MKKKVLMAMSGGVDSSVSAALLLEQGYEVIGAFMKNWSGDVHGACDPGDDTQEKECGWRGERRDALRVASTLGIPLMTFDFEEEYRQQVIENMFHEFEAGRTPNPDILCNKFIKFDLLMREADRLGCDFVATGHYARVQDGKILKGIDTNKDQTYFLWAINRDVIPRVLFPLGELEKPEVRKKAEEIGLSVAQKKDSTGICFVGEVDLKKFLLEKLPKKPGAIVTVDGKHVGTHDGLAFYTIGQREGLNIGGGTGEPLYVLEKRLETNELVVGSNFHPTLFKQELVARQLNWLVDVKKEQRVQAQIRYRQSVQDCVVHLEGDAARVVFDNPQRAVTSGQSIVFYDGDVMLGGGIID